MSLSLKQKQYLIQNYPLMDNKILAEELNISIGNLTRKASAWGVKKISPYDVVDGKKLCSTCKKMISIEKFYVDKQNRSGYRYECMDCYNLKHRSTEKFKIEKIIKETHEEIEKKEKPKTKANNRNSYGIEGTRPRINKKPRNDVIIINGVLGKKCNRCKKWKPLDGYAKDKKGIAQKRATCKECYKILNKKRAIG